MIGSTARSALRGIAKISLSLYHIKQHKTAGRYGSDSESGGRTSLAISNSLAP